MSRDWRFGSFRHAFSLALPGSSLAFAALTAQGQTSSDSQQPAAKTQNAEVVSRDTPAAFKVRVNNVLVRVVVRDTDGKVITNLKKEDFQLADNRKLQVISTFAVETPGSHIATVKMDADTGSALTEGTPVKQAELPQRFITLIFDDLHLSTQDVLLSRQAAAKLFAAIQTGDRLSIFTTSGQVQQEFTAERDKLEGALQRIVPRPISSHGSIDCPPMTLYEAYQIVEANDPMALGAATADALACAGPTGPLLVQPAAQRALATGESEMQFSFRNLDALIARMRGLPGQRIIVMMSPGYFVTPAMHESGDIIDRATTANIVINTIDARGLYTSSVFDAANPGGGDPAAFASRSQFIMTEETIQDDILGEMAPEALSFTTAMTSTKAFSTPPRNPKSLMFWASRRKT